MGQQKDFFHAFFNDVIKLLVSMVEERDIFIRGHSERVADLCSSFAKDLSLPKKASELLYLAGMLHDIGMVYIPYDLINKPGRLNEDELKLVRQHPLIAEKLLSQVNMFKDLIPIIRHHHEHFDGSGYPDGLEGAAIPLEARILCLVDSYDAMLSSRPYRSGMNMEEALEEINKKKDALYDGNLVDKFITFVSLSTNASVNKKEGKPVRNVIQKVINKFRGGNIDLPILPYIINELKKVIEDPNSTQETLSQILEKDAVVTIRLISVANSPIYRGAEKVLSVKQAVTRLGLRETHSIVFTIANKNLYKTNDKKLMTLMESMWQHSLACAYCSKSIANALKVADSEKYYLMGLLHDIGKVLLLQTITELPPEDLTDNLEIDEITISETIQKAHTVLGSALLNRWGFNDEFAQIARQHENTTFNEDIDKSVLIINLANMLTRKIGYSLFSNNNIDIESIESRRLLGIDPTALLNIGEEVSSVMKSSAGVF